MFTEGALYAKSKKNCKKILRSFAQRSKRRNRGGDTVKKLLNTLYVLTPESYLFCRNDNVCVQVGGEEKLAVPALTID